MKRSDKDHTAAKPSRARLDVKGIFRRLCDSRVIDTLGNSPRSHARTRAHRLPRCRRQAEAVARNAVGPPRSLGHAQIPAHQRGLRRTQDDPRSLEQYPRAHPADLRRLPSTPWPTTSSVPCDVARSRTGAPPARLVWACWGGRPERRRSRSDLSPLNSPPDTRQVGHHQIVRQYIEGLEPTPRL